MGLLRKNDNRSAQPDTDEVTDLFIEVEGEEILVEKLPGETNTEAADRYLTDYYDEPVGDAVPHAESAGEHTDA